MNDLNLNPYRPPAAAIEPLAVEEELVCPKASKWKRLFNLILDYAVLIGLIFLITVVLMTLEELGVLQGVYAWFDDPSSPLDTIMVLLLAGYYIGLEWLFGRSVGKLITGTKVVATAGGRPSFLAVVGRTCCRFVPFDAFSALGTNVWHDSWSGTRVVDVRQPKIPKPAAVLHY